MQASSSGGLGVLKVQLTFVAFGVGLAVLVDAALASRLPLLGRLRAFCRRALRPWLWGFVGRDRWRRAGWRASSGALSLAIEPQPPTLGQQLARARIMMSVLAGSLLAAFSTLPSFKTAFLTAFAPASLAVDAVLTALVLFFMDPVLESVTSFGARRIAASGGSAAAAVELVAGSDRIRPADAGRVAAQRRAGADCEHYRRPMGAPDRVVRVADGGDHLLLRSRACTGPSSAAASLDRALEASIVAGTLVLSRSPSARSSPSSSRRHPLPRLSTPRSGASARSRPWR